MAASESGDSSVDGSGDGEREEFMRKLQEYHDTRGCVVPFHLPSYTRGLISTSQDAS